MISFIITIIKLLVILGVVATIHEFGHFIFAKIFKMGVNEFSIGFGPKLFQKEYKGTMYSLRGIPLGGYCAIEGDEGDSKSPSAFCNKNIFQKVIVLIMGATFNAILATIIFVSIAMSFPTYTTKVTEFAENSVLKQAGVEVGDTITAINGEKVSLQSELLKQNTDTGSRDAQIEYIHDGQKKTTTVKNAITDIGYIGTSFQASKDSDEVSNVIEMVASGGAAAKAGLKAGDKIVSVNGTKTALAVDIVSMIRGNAGKEITLEIDRKGELTTKTLVADAKKLFDLNIVATEKVATSIPLAFVSAWDNIKTIVGSYVDLFSGKVGVQDMSGIVGIGEVVSKTSGILEFLNLMGIISLAVGVANLMPFPPLDGGKVVIVIGESIVRKKIPARAEAIISYIGFGLLIALTLVVTYNDLLRIF